ncbi:MAG: hypothetical protein P8M25_01090, partial [Paracoccaceae bacterium]|nr:hypothetical protein [Paracoccaceae bacterium]
MRISLRGDRQSHLLGLHFPKIWFETSDFSRKRSYCAPQALKTTEPFDFSRRRFSAIYRNKTATNARRFLRDLERACPIHIRTILTDN